MNVQARWGNERVGCVIPVWRKSMPCSGVPSCIQVSPGSSSCFQFCLKSTSMARMPYWQKTNAAFPFWWCIRKNVPEPPFAATGTDRTVTAGSIGGCLFSGTTTTALALQLCMCWSTTATICGGGKPKPKHAFAKPGMWLTS